MIIKFNILSFVRVTKLVLLAFMFSFSLAKADRLKEIQKNDVLRVAVYSDRWGFASNQDNKLVGHDVDIARSVAKHLGLRLKLIPIKSEERISIIENNGADLTIATLSINDARKQKIDFSIPYFRTATSFISLRENKINSRKDFSSSGLICAITKGSSMEQTLKESYPEVKSKLYETLIEAFDDFRAGKIGCVVQLRHYLITQLVRIEDVNERVKYKISHINLRDNVELFGIGIPKGENNLREAINQILVDMEENGELEAIYNKYFGYKSSNPILRTFKVGLDNGF